MHYTHARGRAHTARQQQAFYIVVSERARERVTHTVGMWKCEISSEVANLMSMITRACSEDQHTVSYPPNANGRERPSPNQIITTIERTSVGSIDTAWGILNEIKTEKSKYKCQNREIERKRDRRKKLCPSINLQIRNNMKCMQTSIYQILKLVSYTCTTIYLDLSMHRISKSMWTDDIWFIGVFGSNLSISQFTRFD